jgi:hypothetical protein
MRVCMFCGEEIADDAPPEHVLPKWLRKFLAKGERFTQRHGAFRDHPDAPTVRWGQWEEHDTKHPAITIDTVCAGCNHGWMSDLETEASPLLTPMIEGNPVGLSVEQQALVARWSTKTAMAYDQLLPAGRRHYTAEECRWAMEQTMPPPDTTVRLGHYSGTAFDFIDVKHEALYWERPADPEIRAAPDAYRTLLVIGKLVIDLGVRRPINAMFVNAGSVSIDDLMPLVWPTSEARSWPPRLGLNDNSVASLQSPKDAG